MEKIKWKYEKKENMKKERKIKKNEYIARNKKSNMHLSGVPYGMEENGQHNNNWECSRIGINPQKQEAQDIPNSSKNKKEEEEILLRAWL